ncbi:hypothetical protein [Actinomadura sp. GTD37]|uniref:hypothetical protein n=1 Tax=Actinomadura sp. GTD37 TaxID=1778030 RepID=UPI0035C1904C
MDDQAARGIARGRVLRCPRWAEGEPHAPHAWEDPDYSAYELLWCEGTPSDGLLNDLVTARDLISRMPHFRPRTIFTAPVFKEPLVMDEPEIGPSGPSGIYPAGAIPGAPAALPPFSGDDPTCVKCGNVGAITKYRPCFMVGDCHHPGIGALQGVEHLDRECGRCDYTWPEATFETKEPTQ